MILIQALREIRAGDECSISYIDTNQPLANRRKKLLEEYFFTCACVRCIEEGNGRDKKIQYQTKKQISKLRIQKEV